MLIRLVCILLVSIIPFLIRPSNQIVKIEKKEKIMSDVIKLYCTQDSLFTFIPDSSTLQNQARKVAFFIPMTTLNRSAEQELIQGAYHTNAYSLVISRVKLPSQGVKITLTYDPQRVLVKAQPFDLLKDKKGFKILLYDTNLFNQLLAKKNTVLHYAWQEGGILNRTVLRGLSGEEVEELDVFA